MAIFSADVIGFDGLGVTRDLNAPNVAPDTEFTRFLSNYRSYDPENGFTFTSACLVAQEKIALRLVPHDYDRTPTSELEANMIQMRRGIIAHVIPDEIALDTEGVEWNYESRPSHRHGRYRHPLMTVAIGGTATFKELEIEDVPISINRMLLHPPAKSQLLIKPRVNVAELGPLPRVKRR